MNSKEIKDVLLQQFKQTASKKPIHIIPSGKKWAIVKFRAKRASKIYTHREQVYFHAKQMGEHIVVHNEDGTVLFKEGC